MCLSEFQIITRSHVAANAVAAAASVVAFLGADIIIRSNKFSTLTTPKIISVHSTDVVRCCQHMENSTVHTTLTLHSALTQRKHNNNSLAPTISVYVQLHSITSWRTHSAAESKMDWARAFNKINGKYYFPFSRSAESVHTIRVHVWDGIANRPHDTLIHYMTDGIHSHLHVALNWTSDRFGCVRVWQYMRNRSVFDVMALVNGCTIYMQKINATARQSWLSAIRVQRTMCSQTIPKLMFIFQFEFMFIPMGICDFSSTLNL